MNKILVYLSNDKPFIWKSQDVAILREEWHIVGCLTGCLPRYPRQNTYLGLPLQLSPEEVTLLLEKDVISVIRIDDPLPDPSPENVEEFRAFRKRSYQEQIQLFKDERRKEIEQNIPRIKEGKRQKLKKELDAKKQRGEHVEDSEYEREISVNVDEIEILPIAEKHSFVQIYTACPFPMNTSEVTWTYPSTDEEKTRYHVFKDLWEKGHFLTSGKKFGGDYLVYPGDPSRFHSHFIAICLPHKKQMSMLDVISLGRLGSNVRKTVLLCSLDEDAKLCYTSLQWTGMA